MRYLFHMHSPPDTSIKVIIVSPILNVAEDQWGDMRIMLTRSFITRLATKFRHGFWRLASLVKGMKFRRHSKYGQSNLTGS